MAVYKIEGYQWNCYPDTTVLINKLDIRDQKELDALEKQITLLRGIQAVPVRQLLRGHVLAVRVNAEYRRSRQNKQQKHISEASQYFLHDSLRP
jgi:hypothetical protein